MRAHEISALLLDSYQRAARTILAHHLVTTSYPDRASLPLLRRWATELREDLLELFGYRLEVTETTARLFPVIDHLDSSQPARTAADRIFDRRRYAYLALALAALGRAGTQITLSELADHVAVDASHIDGVDLTTDRASDRDGFVDAVGWLALRGAISLADGDAGGWAANPAAGEALYDIDRSVVAALFRPARSVQHLRSIRGLLSGAVATSDEAEPTDRLALENRVDTIETVRKMRRLLLEKPVVYYADLTAEEERHLLAGRTGSDVELLTGLVAERRAEGIALLDASGRMTDIRFPSTGTIAQVALLLVGEIADRVMNPDEHPLEYIDASDLPSSVLAADIDSAIPYADVYDDLAEDVSTVEVANSPDRRVHYPFVETSWLSATLDGLTEKFGRTFAAQWQADHDGLRERALDLLSRLQLVHRLPGGVAVLPVLARYRDVMVSIKERAPQDSLFTDTAPKIEAIQ